MDISINIDPQDLSVRSDASVEIKGDTKKAMNALKEFQSISTLHVKNNACINGGCNGTVNTGCNNIGC